MTKREIVAPLTGRIVPLADVPDAVFAEKILGDGVAIEPDGGDVFAPIDGTVVHVANTLHAVSIEGEDGLEFLVHLGIDTVKMSGEGFDCFVKAGQKIKKGQKIMRMDLAAVSKKGLSTVSPCIISNMDFANNPSFHVGDAVGGKSVIISYEIG